MATKVFISWSGDLSRKLGEALRDWLPASLQYVQPYFSPEDIEKGAKWNTEIAKELESSDIGVICLTLENTEKPWILFEAGALSKSIDKSRVCTLLFDIEPADVKGPLTSFQATRFIRDDFKRLITTINKSAGDAKLEAGVLDNVFEMWWPRLEAKVREILQSHNQNEQGERRSERDMLEEVLELSRMNASRQNRRQPRIRERTIADLMEALDEMLLLNFHSGSDEISHHLMHRLDSPLRHICNENGVPELYHHHRKRLHEIGSFRERKHESNSEEENSNT